MPQIKYHILASIFIFLMISCLVISLTTISKAQGETATSTFPVNEAGISAYVKMNSITIEDLTEALNFFSTRVTSTETYVIGTVKVENAGYGQENYPHLYIGLDGWLVAYYLKDEPASRIMQWKGYTAGNISTTTLKDAIDYMAEKIGVTYSGSSIKYYDFEFPEANKLTIIAETVDYSGGPNSFSLTIPGTLYEASYSVWTGHTYYVLGRGAICLSATLSVDGVTIFQSPEECGRIYYGYYSTSTHLQIGIPHFVEFSRSGGGGAATVLIYKSE